MLFLQKQFQMEHLYIKQDVTTGLIAIIAIHSTKRGPALGGCRFVSYPTVDEAIEDAMKLAEAMTYKSIMAGLPLGGGKSVVIGHKNISDRAKLFEQFGDFVEQLKGKYITATDSGTFEADMKIVATRTQHVTSISKTGEPVDDTAAMTAAGVTKAIEAAVQYKLKKKTLENVHIAIQGVGNVGFLLAKNLIAKGARITISDKNEAAIARASALPVMTVPFNEITQVSCDVFSPCALGGIINPTSLAQLNAPIICGAANNQLIHPEMDEAIDQQKIVYVPDYVANAGGLICAAAQAGVISKKASLEKIENIFNAVTHILQQAQEMRLPTGRVANLLAEQAMPG